VPVPVAAPPVARRPRRIAAISMTAVVAAMVIASGVAAFLATRDPSTAADTAAAGNSRAAPTGTAASPDTSADGATTTGGATENGGTDPTGPASGTGTGLPTAGPNRVGVVDTGAVAADPRAADIAAMFDQHFSGINSRDYPRAIAVYDPAGVIRPDDPGHRQRFVDGVSTTTDSDVRLLAVGPGAGAPVAATARLTFQSQQAPGYGPKDREGETCTRWDITYALTSPAERQYRILRATTATSDPC
jgi:hypothetical protein